LATERNAGQEFRGTVPVEEALAEYERLKAILPPGVEPTIDMMERPWLPRTRAQATVPRHGPRPMTNPAEIHAKRAELLAAEQPHGERSIAKALGVSRDAVRYALGKDRR
jgi:hypothetical protein